MNTCAYEPKVTGIIFLPKKLMKFNPSEMSSLFHGKTIIQTTRRGARIQYKLNKGMVKGRYLKRII